MRPGPELEVEGEATILHRKVAVLTIKKGSVSEGALTLTGQQLGLEVIPGSTERRDKCYGLYQNHDEQKPLPAEYTGRPWRVAALLLRRMSILEKRTVGEFRDGDRVVFCGAIAHGNARVLVGRSREKLAEGCRYTVVIYLGCDRWAKI